MMKIILSGDDPPHYFMIVIIYVDLLKHNC